MPAESDAFDRAAARLEGILRGPARRKVVAELLSAGTPDKALGRLRDGMRSHRFSAGGERVDLEREVRALDERTREEGFHVLQDWDGVADRLDEETIVVEVASFLIRERGRSERGGGELRPSALAVLLDYYFFYLLALLAMRVWDGDPGENVERVSALLEALHGNEGSGHRFVGSAETLFPVATSHFEPDVSAFDRLLGRVRTLDESHRVRVSLVYAAILSSHLRFGFEATYGRDVVAMRNDNAPDYPWLSFSLATLMEAHVRLAERGVEGPERERIVEGLLNGLAPDPRAFLGAAPPSLSEHEPERSRFAELFRREEPDLLSRFERHRPRENAYSPLSLFFNFPHNLVKAMVVDALFRGEPWKLTLNDLLTGVPEEPTLEARMALVETLMAYARASPDRIRGRLVPVIVYDPRAGRRVFRETLRRIRP
jgi:hypothetical protein